MKKKIEEGPAWRQRLGDIEDWSKGHTTGDDGRSLTPPSRDEVRWIFEQLDSFLRGVSRSASEERLICVLEKLAECVDSDSCFRVYIPYGPEK